MAKVDRVSDWEEREFIVRLLQKHHFRSFGNSPKTLSSAYSLYIFQALAFNSRNTPKLRKAHDSLVASARKKWQLEE